MRESRSEDVREAAAVLAVQFSHDLAARALLVHFAVVCHDQDVEEIHHVVRDVVQAPERLLVQGRILVGRDPLVTGEIHEARPRLDRAEVVRVVRPDVPGARAPHRIPGQHDAVFVDRILLLDLGERLEHVDLARGLPR